MSWTVNLAADLRQRTAASGCRRVEVVPEALDDVDDQSDPFPELVELVHVDVGVIDVDHHIRVGLKRPPVIDTPYARPTDVIGRSARFHEGRCGGLAVVQVGVHLPLMDFGAQRFDIDNLVRYVETATALGFDAVSANDHLLYGTPWLDGPTALAAVVSCSGDARLFTTVANPVTRGPVALAKALAALDLTSGGRFTAGLGPGSSARDYESAGVPFEERWPRFDEAVRAIRALFRGESFQGRFYASDGPLEPLASPPNGPPVWVASWGSDAGLRRAVRMGDGWLASAYNISPGDFGAAWRKVQQLLEADGREPDGFENGLATMWFHIDDRGAEEVLNSRLAPAVGRPAGQLRERLAFGSAGQVLDKLTAFRKAGVRRLFVWPVADEIDQLHRFADEVMPALTA
jgi:alkanesulfonate monooxygenase SsuD/methylene tetrahydromethanopterin reductase-like flavin-dependent oxidoreductase (luciferase family)